MKKMIDQGGIACAPLKFNLKPGLATSLLFVALSNLGPKTICARSPGSSFAMEDINLVVEMGEPLPGTTSAKTGAANGAPYDRNGNFSLSDTDQNAILWIAYPAYKMKEVVLKEQTELPVILEQDIAALDAIVGYGTQPITKGTQSLTRANTVDLHADKRPVNLQNTLVWWTPGRTTVQDSRPWGQGIHNSVRKCSALRSESRSEDSADGPLLLLNGFPGNSSETGPSDYVSATPIYGAGGAKGAVLTVLKGTTKNRRPSLDPNNAISCPVQTDDLLDSGAIFMVFNKEAVPNEGLQKKKYLIAIVLPYIDEMLKKARNGFTWKPIGSRNSMVKRDPFPSTTWESMEGWKERAMSLVKRSWIKMDYRWGQIILNVLTLDSR